MWIPIDGSKTKDGTRDEICGGIPGQKHVLPMGMSSNSVLLGNYSLNWRCQKTWVLDTVMYYTDGQEVLKALDFGSELSQT